MRDEVFEDADFRKTKGVFFVKKGLRRLFAGIPFALSSVLDYPAVREMPGSLRRIPEHMGSQKIFERFLHASVFPL